jgi:DNA-binding NarL/FixJ family response regulator
LQGTEFTVFAGWLGRSEYRSIQTVNNVDASPVPKPERRVRILIADDHPIIRKMVRSVLETRPDYEISGEAEDGGQAVEMAGRTMPDAVVLNVTMPVLNGFEAARKIKFSTPHAAIVILSTHADKIFVEQAKEIGVNAYVPKSQASVALLQAIDAALRGEQLFLLA